MPADYGKSTGYYFSVKMPEFPCFEVNNSTKGQVNNTDCRLPVMYVGVLAKSMAYVIILSH